MRNTVKNQIITSNGNKYRINKVVMNNNQQK